MVHAGKFICLVSIRFEVCDKPADQIKQFSDIAVFFCCDQFFHHLFVGTRPQLKTIFLQFFLQMFQQRSPVIVLRKCIDQIRAMLSVQLDLIIDCFLIGSKLIITESVIFSILSDAEMFNIRTFFSLVNQKIRCIRLFRKENIVLV